MAKLSFTYEEALTSIRFFYDLPVDSKIIIEKPLTIKNNYPSDIKQFTSSDWDSLYLNLLKITSDFTDINKQEEAVSYVLKNTNLLESNVQCIIAECYFTDAALSSLELSTMALSYIP